MNQVARLSLFDELARLGGPINYVLEVDIDGDDATFNFYKLP